MGVRWLGRKGSLTGTAIGSMGAFRGRIERGMIEPDGLSVVSSSGNIKSCDSQVLPVRGEPKIQTSRDSNARSSKLGSPGMDSGSRMSFPRRVLIASGRSLTAPPRPGARRA